MKKILILLIGFSLNVDAQLKGQDLCVFDSFEVKRPISNIDFDFIPSSIFSNFKDSLAIATFVKKEFDNLNEYLVEEINKKLDIENSQCIYISQIIGYKLNLFKKNYSILNISNLNNSIENLVQFQDNLIQGNHVVLLIFTKKKEAYICDWRNLGNKILKYENWIKKWNIEKDTLRISVRYEKKLCKYEIFTLRKYNDAKGEIYKIKDILSNFKPNYKSIAKPKINLKPTLNLNKKQNGGFNITPINEKSND